MARQLPAEEVEELLRPFLQPGSHFFQRRDGGVTALDEDDSGEGYEDADSQEDQLFQVFLKMFVAGCSYLCRRGLVI